MRTEARAIGVAALVLLAFGAGSWLGARRAEAPPLAGELAAAPAEADASEAWERERAELEERVLHLSEELARATSERVAREEEFVQFTTMVSELVPPQAPPEILRALGGELPEPAEEPEPDPATLARLDRSRELQGKLQALVVSERLDSLELLEAGVLDEGWIGPVVFRLLDESGRPIGSLCADRLRMEGSRTGRSLTIVLEAGYERRGGQKLPFAGAPPGVERGGERRMFLPHVDPRPWIDACPELFGPEDLTPLVDDGRWDRVLVRQRLNELLALDAELGYWRVAFLGGVLDSELRDVELEHLDRNGHLVRRLFADRGLVALEERGLRVELREGIQMKGGRKYAFLDGRYRIFLPTASQEQWTAAGIPGLVPAKESSAAHPTGPPPGG